MNHAFQQLPLVSIIINNYNYGRFQEAIDSGLNQTYLYRLIVVDDGSTDNSKNYHQLWNRIIPVWRGRAS